VALVLAVLVQAAVVALLVVCLRLVRAGRLLAASTVVVADVVLFFKVAFPGLMFGRGEDAFVIPGIAMWSTGRELPLPVPDVAFVSYLALAVAGCLLVMTASDQAQDKALAPVRVFLAGGDARPSRRWTRGLVLWLLIPLACGWLVFDRYRTDTAPPLESRQAHPSIGVDVHAVSPFAGLAGEQAEEAIARGRDAYAIHCRACHGMRAAGEGPLARGFRLRPADFTDPGTIATVVEAYSFQRILDGGVGLPANGSPWDSAMPRWRDSLDEETAWLALLAAYDIAGVEPMKAEELR
jgi:mono/diheme cytochrome c family protein